MKTRNLLMIGSIALLSACSDSSNNNSTVDLPDVDDDVAEQTEVLLTELVDDIFMASENSEPVKINELEIVDLLNKYKKVNKLKAEYLGRGGAWLDTGSIDDFYNTSAFVSALENRQGLKIACLEEIALNYNWISKKNIKEAISFYGNCLYANYLKKLI